MKNIKQLRAISYAYSAKSKENDRNLLKENNADLLFHFQKTYATIKGFMNAAGKKKEKMIKELEQNILSRKQQLESVGCVSFKYTEIINAEKQFLLYK